MDGWIRSFVRSFVRLFFFPPFFALFREIRRAKQGEGARAFGSTHCLDDDF